MAEGWRVTSQRGTDDVVNGQFIRVMLVAVTTDQGVTNEFRVPLSQYTPENVKAIVDEWFERTQGVANL